MLDRLREFVTHTDGSGADTELYTWIEATRSNYDQGEDRETSEQTAILHYLESDLPVVAANVDTITRGSEEWLATSMPIVNGGVSMLHISRRETDYLGRDGGGMV